MRLNGNEIVLEEEQKLLDFLLARHYKPERVAVELDGAIVRKDSFASVMINNDSTLEVVQFMGGG